MPYCWQNGKVFVSMQRSQQIADKIICPGENPETMSENSIVSLDICPKSLQLCASSVIKLSQQHKIPLNNKPQPWNIALAMKMIICNAILCIFLCCICISSIIGKIVTINAIKTIGNHYRLIILVVFFA